jgi:hypothetical protein
MKRYSSTLACVFTKVFTKVEKKKKKKKKGSNFAKFFNIQVIIRTNTCLDKEVSAHRFHVRIVLLTSKLNHVNML